MCPPDFHPLVVHPLSGAWRFTMVCTGGQAAAGRSRHSIALSYTSIPHTLSRKVSREGQKMDFFKKILVTFCLMGFFPAYFCRMWCCEFRFSGYFQRVFPGFDIWRTPKASYPRHFSDAREQLHLNDCVYGSMELQKWTIRHCFPGIFPPQTAAYEKQ